MNARHRNIHGLLTFANSCFDRIQRHYDAAFTKQGWLSRPEVFRLLARFGTGQHFGATPFQPGYTPYFSASESIPLVLITIWDDDEKSPQSPSRGEVVFTAYR